MAPARSSATSSASASSASPRNPRAPTSPDPRPFSRTREQSRAMSATSSRSAARWRCQADHSVALRCAWSLDQLVDGAVEVVGEFEIGDAVDLPADSTSTAIAALVALRVVPPAVPADVVDLDAPSGRRIGAVGMDREPFGRSSGYWRTSGPIPRRSSASSTRESSPGSGRLLPDRLGWTSPG